jgi:tetratricopeptide (TPR) repeat protein
VSQVRIEARRPWTGLAGFFHLRHPLFVVRQALVVLCCCLPLLPGQPSDSAALDRYFREGETALAEKRYADAERAYEKLRQLNPGTAEVHARLGLIYFQQGKFEQAVPSLRQALKLKPALPNVDILLAMSLSELGRYGEALPTLQKGFRRSADAALKRMAGLQLQRAYTGLQKDDKAVEVALELNRLYPEDPEILYHTSRVYANFAYLTLRKLSAAAPESVWRHLAAGEAYESQGDAGLAIAAYRQVAALDPGRPGIHFRLGRVLLSLSPEEARKEFAQELQVDPTNANAAYELAELHRKSGEIEEARRLFELALKNYPDFEEAQVGLGKVLIALEQPALALPHLQKAVSMNRENEVTHFQLWRAYKALGNVAAQEKALAEFRRLRSRKSRREQAVFQRREVTEQGLDAEVVP